MAVSHVINEIPFCQFIYLYKNPISGLTAETIFTPRPTVTTILSGFASDVPNGTFLA